MTLAVPAPPTILPATAPEGTHDCRLVYVSTTQLRLDRFGGNRIMCQGVRETIPAGGVVLNAPIAASAVSYVWCGPTGGVAGAALYLVTDGTAPVTDVYGMPVHPSFPYLTMVGRAYADASGNFVMTGVFIGVLSYWNRRWLSIAAAANQVTGSTSPVELHGGNRLNAIGFAGDFIRCLLEGSCLNDSANYTYSRIEQVGVGALTALGQHYATVPNAYGIISCHGDYVCPAGGGGVFITTLVGYVNAGVGTWYPQCSMLVWG